MIEWSTLNEFPVVGTAAIAQSKLKLYIYNINPTVWYIIPFSLFFYEPFSPIQLVKFEKCSLIDDVPFSDVLKYGGLTSIIMRWDCLR